MKDKKIQVSSHPSLLASEAKQDGLSQAFRSATYPFSPPAIFYILPLNDKCSTFNDKAQGTDFLVPPAFPVFFAAVVPLVNPFDPTSGHRFFQYRLFFLFSAMALEIVSFLRCFAVRRRCCSAIAAMSLSNTFCWAWK